MAHPEKRAELRDAALQPQRRGRGCRGRPFPWDAMSIHTVVLDQHRSLEGRRLIDLAREQGKHVVDVMLAALVQSGYAIPSQTDAGAHLNTNFCTAGESSYVLSQWVRERQFLSLEDAIRRLTFQPARIMGLRDRGLIREGLAANLMVFDLARIGVTDDEVWHDGPAGTPRRVQGAEGVHHVVAWPGGAGAEPTHGRPAWPCPAQRVTAQRPARGAWRLAV